MGDNIDLELVRDRDYDVLAEMREQGTSGSVAKLEGKVSAIAIHQVGGIGFMFQYCRYWIHFRLTSRDGTRLFVLVW